MKNTDPNPERRPSQRKRILTLLQQGYTLTSAAMLSHGIVDGRKRISELRAMGYPIKDRKGVNAETKAHFNIYYMEDA